MRKPIPTGSVYKRKYKGRDGNVQEAQTWTIKYYVLGKAIRESTGSTDYNDAIKLLRKRMANALDKSQYSEEIARVRVNQLLDMVVDDYRYNRRNSSYDTEVRINRHLRPYFGVHRAVEITSALIKKYTALRLQVAEASTVNKELSFLRRGFRLGLENEPPLVERVPVFHMLPVDNARTGILSHEEYRTIRDFLPPYARIALVIAYHTGARKGEIKNIRIDRINFKALRIDLPSKTTKNKKQRYLPIYGDMRAELDVALSLSDSRCPMLIQKDGSPVFDWEKSWAAACKAAGVKNALFHDLRRTALTNMIEAGFSEKEAMEISGHKTRDVFDRYHIVSERRLKQLGERLEAHMRDKEAEVLGTVSGHRQNGRIN